MWDILWSLMLTGSLGETFALLLMVGSWHLHDFAGAVCGGAGASILPVPADQQHAVHTLRPAAMLRGTSRCSGTCEHAASAGKSRERRGEMANIQAP